MRRFVKYADAEEYAKALLLSGNLDVADFAKDILDALESCEDMDAARDAADYYAKDSGKKTLKDQIDWIGERSDTLATIVEMIADECPEYAETDIDDAIADLIKRRRPQLEYDL